MQKSSFAAMLLAFRLSGSRQRGGLALSRAALLPGHQHRGGDRNRGIGSNNDADNQCEGKSVEHFTTKNEERKHGDEGQARGEHGPAQSLVDAAVDQVRQTIAAADAEVFTDAVEDDNGV